jgi:hypothetical protein
VRLLNAYDCEIIGNILQNVSNAGLAMPKDASMRPNWVVAHNTFSNVSTPELYEDVPLRTPTSLDLQVSGTSVTVKAMDGGNSGGSLQYTFEAREYTGSPDPTALAPVITSSGTYTYSGLVPGHIYAFRCRVTAGASSAWTEWYFLQL